jgi:type VI secretion system protein ImpD/type VI secretion system protein ImpC
LPLRQSVLAGAYFTAAHAQAGARLAAFAFSDPAAALVEWFGANWFEAEKGRARASDGSALRAALERDIAAIDALLGAEVDAILHHPRFQKLEGRWRGLAWLVGGFDPGGRIKVKVLNLSWMELTRDLERAAEFDQSHLFRKIYEEEFGTPGGEPYGLLVIDHEVRHRPGPAAPTDDVTALKLLSSVAAAAFAPVVLSAAPELLGVDTFTDLASVLDPGAPFRTTDYVRWRSLFTQEDIRFLAVALPRVLARLPWHDDPGCVRPFRYDEHAPDGSSRVWMTAGYAFAATAVRAFRDFAWPADVRGVETDRVGGGLVSELVVESFRTDPDHVWIRPSLDVTLSDRQERAMIDVGLMPLSAIPYSEEAVFSSVRGLQTPAQYSGANAGAANASARLSTQMNSLLCASRFAHYLKMLGREMVGSFRTAEEIENQLQQWLRRYVNTNVASGSDSRSRYPLAAGRVTVREKPGRPGVYGCVVQLQPHFQLDDLSATFRLVTEIAGAGTGH